MLVRLRACIRGRCRHEEEESRKEREGGSWLGKQRGKGKLMDLVLLEGKWALLWWMVHEKRSALLNGQDWLSQLHYCCLPTEIGLGDKLFTSKLISQTCTSMPALYDSA